MKKLCAFLLMALLMVPVWAGADDYFIPDPGHFFGETMVKTSGRNYTMYFDEDPRDMFNAYVSLLQTDYEMKKLSITDTDHIFTYDGVHDSGVTISYISGKDGYRIEVSLHSLVSTGKREQYDPDWAAEEEPAQQKSAAKGQIAWDDGLSVMSPEQYLGIKPCDQIYQQDNWYCYTYTNRGYKWYRHGTSNPVDWYKMKEYVDALVASGYYEILQYDMPYSDQEYWCLDYIGPGKVTKTFGVNRNTTQRAAIIVQSNLGDIRVYFSLDITAHDLDETQKRLGTDIFVKSNNNGPSILPTCDACNGSGDCTYCWGSGTDGITGRDCAVCDRGNCSYCHGSGHK